MCAVRRLGLVAGRQPFCRLRDISPVRGITFDCAQDDNLKKKEKKEMAIKEKSIKVKLTFTEEVLGTSNNDPEIHDNYIASKAPDAPSRAQEVEALGIGEVVERSMTVFPRMDDGLTPFIWNYQIKGFFKEFKKIIDGNIFVEERKIPLQGFGRIGECQRPLRASTAQGERIALAHSETVPAKTYIVFTITCTEHDKYDLMAAVKEWLDYGKRRGLLQWRNSGKGTFVWEEIE